MRIEILCTGNELLDGSVVDTNSAWFEARCFSMGVEVREKRVVPDHLPTLVAALGELTARADLVVVSGGMGPTPDDLTAEALAQAAGVPLVEDARTVERLAAFMASRGRPFSEAQRRQALVPRGCEVLDNDFGTAPHLQQVIGRCRVVCLPGVPREFIGLSERYVLPLVASALRSKPDAQFHAFGLVRCIGIWEAEMAARVKDLPARIPGLRLGTRTSAPENHLKFRTSAATQAEADAQLAEAIAYARAQLGEKVYATGETTFARATFEALKGQGATVAFAESLTAGLAAGMLAEVPGASAVLRGGFVTYTDEMKRLLLGVDAALLASHGAVSEPVARAMAEGCRARTGATYGIAITGWAGPDGGTEADPVGTYYAARSGPDGTVCERVELPIQDRERIRRSAAFAALDLARRAGR